MVLEKELTALHWDPQAAGRERERGREEEREREAHLNLLKPQSPPPVAHFL